MIDLKFKRLTPTMTVPTKAHPTDACFDLYADCPESHYRIINTVVENGVRTTFIPRVPLEKGGVTIEPHQTIIINTGFATNIPHGYWGAIFARSGVATKKGLRPAQGVPVIDEPYTGEWKIPLHNDTDEPQVILHGDRIAQFMLLPYFDTNLIEVDELDSTDRGSGGFGSSGK